MDQNDFKIKRFSASLLQTVGFVGDCNCGESVRKRVDAFLLFHSIAHQGLRVVAGVDTRFERLVVERIAALRVRFPQTQITVLVGSEEWKHYRKALHKQQSSASLQMLELADEIVLVPQMRDEEPHVARLRMLTDTCDQMLEGYKCRGGRQRGELRRIIAASGGNVKLYSLSGDFVQRISRDRPELCGGEPLQEQ